MENNNNDELQLVGFIYAIKSKNTDKFYVGSTTQKLEERLSRHKSHLKSYSAGKRGYVSSFEILNHGDVYIQMLEEGRFQTKKDLHRREGDVIKQLKGKIVNKNIAGRKFKEYYQENKEKLNIKTKEYYQDNKERINNAKLTPVICACGAISSKNNISTHLKTKKHQKYLASMS